MLLMPHARRTLVALGTLAVLATPSARLDAQASVNVYLESGLSSCGGSPRSNPSGTPTSMAWVDSHNMNGCNLRGSAHSYLGHVGATAKTALNTGDWSSGGIRVSSSGGWNDALKAQISQSYLSQGVRQMAVTFNIGAHGFASAFAAAGSGSGSSATVGYAFQLGNVQGTGGQSADQSGPTSNYGTWGTITSTVMVYANQLANGQFEFNSVGFSLSGWALAGSGKGYNPGLIADTGAEGDFGSTLVWEGVSAVHAYDANMNEIALGSDADFAFIGQQTGFDYQASVVPVTATPEPGSLLLVASGMLALVAYRRKKVS